MYEKSQGGSLLSVKFGYAAKVTAETIRQRLPQEGLVSFKFMLTHELFIGDS